MRYRLFGSLAGQGAIMTEDRYTEPRQTAADCMAKRPMRRNTSSAPRCAAEPADRSSGPGFLAFHHGEASHAEECIDGISREQPPPVIVIVFAVFPNPLHGEVEVDATDAYVEIGRA